MNCSDSDEDEEDEDEEEEEEEVKVILIGFLGIMIFLGRAKANRTCNDY